MRSYLPLVALAIACTSTPADSVIGLYQANIVVQFSPPGEASGSMPFSSQIDVTSAAIGSGTTDRIHLDVFNPPCTFDARVDGSTVIVDAAVCNIPMLFSDLLNNSPCNVVTTLRGSGSHSYGMLSLAMMDPAAMAFCADSSEPSLPVSWTVTAQRNQ
jgi:hypothetical protein